MRLVELLEDFLPRMRICVKDNGGYYSATVKEVEEGADVVEMVLEGLEKLTGKQLPKEKIMKICMKPVEVEVDNSIVASKSTECAREALKIIYSILLAELL